jgi:hypothetical protein
MYVFLCNTNLKHIFQIDKYLANDSAYVHKHKTVFV